MVQSIIVPHFPHVPVGNMVSLFTLFLTTSSGCLGQTESNYHSSPSIKQYDAGMRDISFIDGRGKELSMTVWYPTFVIDERLPDSYEPFSIALNAYKATTPVVENAPLIAFSHGFFAIRYQSAFLMEHLAQQGFVVVAVDHPFNTLYDFEDEKTPIVLLERPDDVRSAVDKIVELSEDETDPLFGMVDGSQYIAMGHSFGSHTATVLGGGKLDYDGLVEYCTEFPNERACNYLSGLENVELSQFGCADERVIATIAISPGLWYTFGADGTGLQSVTNPLVIAGNVDGVLRYETEALPYFDALSSPKHLFTMTNTGHYGMTNICDIAGFLSEECTEDGWQSVDMVQASTNEIVFTYVKHIYLGTSFEGEDLEQDWVLHEGL